MAVIGTGAVSAAYGHLSAAQQPSAVNPSALGPKVGEKAPDFSLTDQHRQGVVTSRFFEDTYQERDTISSILVRVGERVHVYAPGATGYRPIGVAVTPQADLVVRDAHFPRPEDYFFKPLNEHVPVYQKAFRIVQDVMLDPSRDAAAALRVLKSMTIGATLNYQACDDLVCFNPQSIPLTWTIGVRRLDSERAAKP
jgi:hypothetical protein